MSKVKLTKQQAALVPELQKTWTVFAGLTPEQKEVVRRWDGRLSLFSLRGNWSNYNASIDDDSFYVYRIPADAEYEVVEDEQEYVDVMPNKSSGGSNYQDLFFTLKRKGGSISHNVADAPRMKGFLGYVWEGESEPSAEWYRVGKDSVTYCKAVRFRKGGAS